MKSFIKYSLVLLLGFVLTCCNSKLCPTYAQTVDTQQIDSLSPPPVDAEVTTREIYDDVKGALNQLADGLKVGAEHVYSVLVRQQVVMAIVWSIFSVAGVAGFIVFVVLFNKALMPYTLHKRWKAYDDNYTQVEHKHEVPLTKLDDNKIVIPVIIVIISVIFILLGVINADEIVTGFVNPEYGAIQEILELIK